MNVDKNCFPYLHLSVSSLMDATLPVEISFPGFRRKKSNRTHHNYSYEPFHSIHDVCSEQYLIVCSQVQFQMDELTVELTIGSIGPKSR